MTPRPPFSFVRGQRVDGAVVGATRANVALRFRPGRRRNSKIRGRASRSHRRPAVRQRRVDGHRGSGWAAASLRRKVAWFSATLAGWCNSISPGQHHWRASRDGAPASPDDAASLARCRRHHARECRRRCDAEEKCARRLCAVELTKGIITTSDTNRQKCNSNST